jgi:predicted ABC-type ATPase
VSDLGAGLAARRVRAAQPRPAVLGSRLGPGPNGAGKTTLAAELLPDELGVNEFVNADVIARGLSGFDPDRAAIAAGRVMLARLNALSRQRESFAFETTLASRSFAPWIQELRASGYRVHLFFLWLASSNLAVQRVADRVRLGGHDVPVGTIRRRYRSGLRNLLSLYQPIVTAWSVYDCSGLKAKLVAESLESAPITVYDREIWAAVLRQGSE